MASTDSDDQSSKARTKPMSGYESLRLDQPALPIPETMPPASTPAGYGDTAAPTHARADGTPLPAPAPAAMGTGSTFRDYKLGRMLGRGGFGKVYLADAPGGVPVAIKIVEARRDDNEAAGRELQALEVIKTLRHPYLLSTHAFYSEEEQLAIVMELADGSLRDELEKSRKAGKVGLPPEVLIRYMVEAGEAIDYLHDKKMTHRDIKPENILILAGHAKVADFGLVRVVQENRAQASVPLTGTLAYMAPEVFRGHTHKNSDQYALALTYLELRFGERFVTTTDLVEAMLRHVEHEPDLSRAEPHEQKVIQRALTKDPEQRFGSCTEMARALAEGFGRTEIRGKSGRPVWEPEPTRGPAQPPKKPTPGLKQKEQPKRRKPPVAILAGAAVIGILAIGAVLFAILGGKHGPPPPTSKPDSPTVATGWPEDVVKPKFKSPWKLEAVDGSDTVTDDGKKYYREIDLVLDADTRIRFIFIPQHIGDPPGTEVKSFYLMRDKVSHALFKRYADTAVKLQNSNWEKGAMTEDGPQKKDDWPVMNVSAEDALMFADWLGGDLPSVEEWKKAAGFYDRAGRAGPYEDGWQEKDAMGINRSELGPLGVNKSTKDRSIYKIRDMAGNGKEWTRDFHLKKTRLLPGVKPDRFDKVDQVGKSYAAEDPLSFTELEYNKIQGRDDGTPEGYCGFRVMLNVP